MRTYEGELPEGLFSAFESIHRSDVLVGAFREETEGAIRYVSNSKERVLAGLRPDLEIEYVFLSLVQKGDYAELGIHLGEVKNDAQSLDHPNGILSSSEACIWTGELFRPSGSSYLDIESFSIGRLALTTRYAEWFFGFMARISHQGYTRYGNSQIDSMRIVERMLRGLNL